MAHMQSRSIKEFLELKSLLYSDHEVETTQSSQKRMGICLVDIYRRQAKLPHAVEATAWLQNAILNHQENLSSRDSKSIMPYNIVFVYATAFARFVTGFCDTPSTGTVKKSMYEVAEDIHMPEHWVEARHEITHGHMPSLDTLQIYSQEALDWLWDQFWVMIPLNESITSNIINIEDLRGLLKALFKARRDELRNQPSRNSNEILNQLLETCKTASDITLLSEAFVSTKILYPKKEISHQTMNAAFYLWAQPLQTVCSHLAGSSSSSSFFFFDALVTQLAGVLARPATVEPEHDHDKAAAFAWLRHLLQAERWAAQQRASGLVLSTAASAASIGSTSSLPTALMERCLLWPGYWSTQLAAMLLDMGDARFVRDWKDMLPSERDGGGDSHMSPGQQGSHMSVDEGSGTIPGEAEAAIGREPRAGGWRLWEGTWAPRPLGM